MGGGLSARLKRIQESTAAKRGITDEGTARETGNRTPPSGWSTVKPLVFYRETEYVIQFPEKIDARPFLLRRIGAALRHAGRDDAQFAPELAELERGRLCFVDIETTGLSTGAGTVAFAFGAGSFLDGKFAVRQLFLEDYSGEPDFIELLLSMIGEDAVIVSYNGAAFDLGVLRARCIMSGTRFPERGHIDLLRTARRLWSRPCGGASLALIEELVLRSPRVNDLPGSQAPERYFEFLRNGDFSRVEPVLDHHRLDIAALPVLLDTANAVFSSPLEAKSVDTARLGLCLAALDRPEWEKILKGAYREGQTEAGMLMAALYKRRGRWREAIQLWREMEKTPKTARELAIAFERRTKDLPAARQACFEALGLELTKEERKAFGSRLERIEKRLERENDKKKTI